MKYNYLPVTNKKLGMIYSEEKTVFRLWSPLRGDIELLLYQDAMSPWRRSYKMQKFEDGTHEVIIEGDLKGQYYNYLIDKKYEVTDPYALASSINSLRTAIIDLKDSDPIGWDQVHIKHNQIDTPIIYEVHVKDFTFHKNSGVKNRGKYLGFVEKDTKYQGLDTGLSHLMDLGVTHIHLMPVYDFLTVREEDVYFSRDDNYNWGYDPELYNVPEGSYATKPEDPISRIRELKTLIMEVKKAGLNVVLDVVYNHTYRNFDSNFNVLMPNYYYRIRDDGSFSDGSSCGNELATERYMVEKFIIDSLLYWVEEYKVDGFRFDLMGLIDIKTVTKLVNVLREVHPNILIYGEPWTGGITILNNDLKTRKGRQSKAKFALFNDDFRDAIRGDNDGYGQGFIHGNLDCKAKTETGIAGSIYYDDGRIGFTTNALETINYVNSHDNLILADKIKKTFEGANEDFLEKINKLALSILFTSQGIPLIHAGNEFLRSKNMVSNSYNSAHDINTIDWALKEKNYSFYKYCRDLISLRKEYKGFNLKTDESIRNSLGFLDMVCNCKVIAYTLVDEDLDERLLIIHNAGSDACYISKKMIEDHLRDRYMIYMDEVNLIPVFGMDGLSQTRLESNYSIKIEDYSTSVYEIQGI